MEMQVTSKERCKSLLLRTHRIWSVVLPSSYRAYNLEGGWIYLNIKESHKMLERVLRCYEPWRYQALRHFLRPGFTFVDVGCNKGDFCLAASRLVGPEGRVLAFEPHPENCRWIRKSIARNQYRNIDLYDVALSDTNGVAHLCLGETSGQHTLLGEGRTAKRGFIEVQTRTLDHLLDDIGLSRPVDAIKIDVEGAEMHVLRGARETFIKNRGIVVLLDLHPNLGVNVGELCEFSK